MAHQGYKSSHEKKNVSLGSLTTKPSEGFLLIETKSPSYGAKGYFIQELLKCIYAVYPKLYGYFCIYESQMEQ